MTHRLAATVAVALTALVMLLGSLRSVAEAAPWGGSGADYEGGILCQLGLTSVPLATWTVNGGVPAFSTEDVVGNGVTFGPAPTTGTASTMVAGQAGFSAADIAAAAYLITKYGAGSATDVAETSASIAAIGGGGGAQAACLGQQGTSAAQAASRLQEARRLAGPYTVTVATPARTSAGQQASVTATVRSASGAVVPGLDVQFAAGTSTQTATTGADGVATTELDAPTSAAVPVKATVTAPVDLIFYTTSPASVSAAPPTAVSGTASLAPPANPKPVVSVATDTLALANGTLTPKVSVTGTANYPGDGQILVTGPVKPGSAACASLSAAALAAGPQAWTGSFTFTADGTQSGGSTPPLAPGCYAVRATVDIASSTPPVKAASSQTVVTVSTLSLVERVPKAVAPLSGLVATITGTNPGTAQVSTAISTRGPLSPRNGVCDGGLDWTKAATAGTGQPVALTKSGSGLTASLRAPAVTRPGCYSLSTVSTVQQDGASVTARSEPGADGSVVLVSTPTLSIASSGYAGLQGTPMTGTLTLSGTYRFAGTVRVGLVSSGTTPLTGCRDATFPAPPTTADATTTSLTTRGDGAYRYRSPVPRDNTCYALYAVVNLTENPAVTGRTPAASQAAVFLAGVAPQEARSLGGTDGTRGGALRPAIVFGIVLALLFGGCAALYRRTVGWARDNDEFGGRWRWHPYRAEDSLEDAALLATGRPGAGGIPNLSEARPRPRPGQPG